MTAGMTQHEWKCVFEDRALLFVSKGIHTDGACHTACSVHTGDSVETCYMQGELLLNPTGVSSSAMLAVHGALECIQSNAVTSAWHKKYVKTVALLKYIKQFGDLVVSVVMEEAI